MLVSPVDQPVHQPVHLPTSIIPRFRERERPKDRSMMTMGWPVRGGRCAWVQGGSSPPRLDVSISGTRHTWCTCGHLVDEACCEALDGVHGRGAVSVWPRSMPVARLSLWGGGGRRPHGAKRTRWDGWMDFTVHGTGQGA
jgi:hypothetical protein